MNPWEMDWAQSPKAPAGLAPQYTPPDDGGNVVSRAKKMYPYLKDVPMSYTKTPDDGTGRHLEYWSPEDSGGWEYQGKKFHRPNSLPLGTHGVEVFNDKVSPKDILGDYVSHAGVETDPKLKEMYGKFAASVDPQIMQERYQHAVDNSGEKRPLSEWVQQSGMPEYFRGYTFDQWPGTPYHEMYTPDQITQLDAVKQHLGINDDPPVGLGLMEKASKVRTQ